jgi:hypothetical protein
MKNLNALSKYEVEVDDQDLSVKIVNEVPVDGSQSAEFVVLTKVVAEIDTLMGCVKHGNMQDVYYINGKGKKTRTTVFKMCKMGVRGVKGLQQIRQLSGLARLAALLKLYAMAKVLFFKKVVNLEVVKSIHQVTEEMVEEQVAMLLATCGLNE